METNTKIPKIIHYCWFGKNRLSNMANRCIKSWKKYLPDYQIKLWNEENFDIKSNIYVKEAYEMKKWAFVSDYVRLFALYNEGGIYMDCDMEVLKNLDDFLIYPAFSGFESYHNISTGIIGSEKGNVWIRLLLHVYKDKKFILENNELDLTPNTVLISDISQRYGLIRNNQNQILHGGVHIFSKDYFCPLSYDNAENNFSQNTHTIHHFLGSWLPRKQRLIQMFAMKPSKRIIKQAKSLKLL